MTHPTYPPVRIAAAYRAERDLHPDTPVSIIADYAAFRLAGWQASDEALEDASGQIIGWLARQAVERA